MIELDPRQQARARVVKLVSTTFLTTLATFAMLTLAGLPGTAMKLWVGICGALSVNLYLFFKTGKPHRRT